MQIQVINYKFDSNYRKGLMRLGCDFRLDTKVVELRDENQDLTLSCNCKNSYRGKLCILSNTIANIDSFAENSKTNKSFSNDVLFQQHIKSSKGQSKDKPPTHLRYLVCQVTLFHTLFFR